MTQEREDMPDFEEPSEFGMRLRRRREAKDIPPQTVAAEAGVSVRQIYRIESGRSRNLRESTMKRVARALGEKIPLGVVRKTEQAARIGGLEFIDSDPHREEDYPDEPGVCILQDISEGPSGWVEARMSGGVSRIIREGSGSNGSSRKRPPASGLIIKKSWRKWKK